MTSFKPQTKENGRHRFCSRALVLAIVSSIISQCDSQAGARPKSTQRTHLTKEQEEANQRAIYPSFRKQEARMFINIEEHVFRRVEPATNINYLLEGLPGELLEISERDRPGIDNFLKLKGLFLETRPFPNDYSVSYSSRFYSETEKVILPILNAERKLMTQLIYVGFDGLARFSTPYKTPYQINRRTRELCDRVIIYEDNKNNTYVMLPLKNNERKIYGRIQLWVKPSRRFADKITKEHLFQKHGYYQIQRIYAPDWIKMQFPFNEDIKNAPQKVVKPVPSRPDKFELGLYWTPGECAHLVSQQYWVDKEICNEEGKWVIHGLFEDEKPPKYEYRKMACYNEIINKTRTFLNPREWRNQTIVSELNKWWPSLRIATTNVQWWEIEWCVHGRYMFNKSEEYFLTALELLEKSGLKEPFSRDESAFPDNDNIIPFSNIEESIERRVSKTVDFYCYLTSNYYAAIEQVKIRFDRDKDVINIDRMNTQTCLEHNKYKEDPLTIIGIHHFPRYQMISYLVFTLVLAESQKRRFRNPVKNYKYKYWKIHGLCPNLKMKSIITHYVRERTHFNYNMEASLVSNSGYNQHKENISFIWPSLEQGVYHEQFWLNKWMKCGFPLTSLNESKFQDPWNYITTTVWLFNLLKPDYWRLQNKYYTPDSFYQSLQFMTKNIQALEIPPNYAILVCTDIDGETGLVKLRLCFSLKFELFRCPPSEVELVHDIVRHKIPARPYTDCSNGFNLKEVYRD